MLSFDRLHKVSGEVSPFYALLRCLGGKRLTSSGSRMKGRSKRSIAASPRSYVGRPATVVALGTTLVVTALGASLWYDRGQILADGARSAKTLSHVLQEQTARTIQAVDQTLLAMIDLLLANPRMDAHDPVYERTLGDRLKSLPYIRALLVLDATGAVVQNSDPMTIPSGGLSDRDYYKAHVQDPDLTPKIGRPQISRATGNWFLSVTRRFNQPNGSFGGVVVAAVEPFYFVQFYRDLGLGPNDSIGLFRNDGILIARIPHHDEMIGDDVSRHELFRKYLPQSTVGTYRTAHSFVDGAARTISYRALAEYPLTVAVGLNEDDLLRAWRRNAVGTAIAAVALTALTIVIAVLWYQRFRERERARQHQLQAQKLEALGRMTGGIAHDFNNMMAVVASGLTVLRGQVGRDDLKSIADTAMVAVQRGSSLTGQLLAFARREELKVAPADVNMLIGGIEQLLRNAAGSGVDMRFELEPSLPACWTDQTQFDTALLNLVVNARDAMPEGGRIRISTVNAAQYVCVSVADIGQGMPPEVLRKALDPFFTTKGEKGTGLGLSQVYGFLRQSGGDLQIESDVGVGTTVHLYFRVAP
ncbi:ATP-binding protein [Azospirillum melinis]